MAAAAQGKQTGLRKKLGPLPVWAWALLLLAVAAWFLFRHSSPAAAASSDTGQTSGPQLPSESGDSSGGAGGAGLDPSLLAALAQQNSTLEQGLLDAFRGVYSGGYNASSATGAATTTNIASTLSPTEATTPAALSGDSFAAPVTSTYSYTAPAVITQPMQIPSASPFASNTDTSGGPADQIARGSVGGGASSSDVVPFNQTILARQVTPQTSPSNPTPSLSAARGATGKGQVLQ